MKVAEVTFCEEVARNLKWSWRGETFDAGFFVRVVVDGAIELAVSAIGSVERFEWRRPTSNGRCQCPGRGMNSMHR